MTGEEAIKQLEDLDNCYNQLSDNDRDALDMAIKALEQQSTLDKIRAEIEGKIVKRPWLDFEDRERDRNDAFLEVLDIIDKYKVKKGEMENV